MGVSKKILDELFAPRAEQGSCICPPELDGIGDPAPLWGFEPGSTAVAVGRIKEKITGKAYKHWILDEELDELGEEQERHVIDKTTIVSIPPGLVHCPMAFTKVERPIIFGTIALERVYKKVMPEKKPE